MEIWIKSADEATEIRIPVLPESITVNGSMNNTRVNVATAGEVTLIGKDNLEDVNFSSHFPAQRFSKVSDDVELLAPYDYADIIDKLKFGLCRLIVTDTNINMLCTIESFQKSEQDPTGDVYYTLDLKKYREINYRTYHTKKKYTKSYKVKSGDTLKKIAKKVTGKSSYSKSIYKQNKSVIEKAAKKHKKTSSKSGKYLYKGTKLVIAYVA